MQRAAEAVLAAGVSAVLLAGPAVVPPPAEAGPIVSRTKTTAEQELLEELLSSGD